MKRRNKCPKCGCTQLWHAKRVAENRDTGTRQTHGAARLAVIGKGTGGRAGRMEAYVCQECRLVEHYLIGDLPVDGEWITELDGGQASPYR
ncbi:MAG: hypothetical protein JRI23_07695 [Deltaproteobacteria bacterium]|jgi:hypothetical protein|nr:hypothetical protein [Deltaproteobacteria bacterium]MBW2531488.1 hypothetical protein [Deltaproteobacteria bacterium]